MLHLAFDEKRKAQDDFLIKSLLSKTHIKYAPNSPRLLELWRYRLKTKLF